VGEAMVAITVFGSSVALGLPIAVAFASHAQSRAAVAACEAVARQPEAAGHVWRFLMLTLVLIESLVIYALVAFFVLQGLLARMVVH